MEVVNDPDWGTIIRSGKKREKMREGAEGFTATTTTAIPSEQPDTHTSRTRWSFIPPKATHQRGPWDDVASWRGPSLATRLRQMRTRLHRRRATSGGSSSVTGRTLPETSSITHVANVKPAHTSRRSSLRTHGLEFDQQSGNTPDRSSSSRGSDSSEKYRREHFSNLQADFRAQQRFLNGETVRSDSENESEDDYDTAGAVSSLDTPSASEADHSSDDEENSYYNAG